MSDLYQKVTFDQIKETMWNLADKYQKEVGQPEVCIGIGAGGWIMARPFVDALSSDLKPISFGIRRYRIDSEEAGPPEIYQQIDGDIINSKNVVVIDDVIDDGITINFAKDEILKYEPKRISLIVFDYKDENIFEKDGWYSVIYGNTIAKNIWRVYPGMEIETAKKLLISNNKDEQNFIKEFKRGGFEVNEIVKIMETKLIRELLEENNEV